jgi:hypothetical protein
LDGFTLSDSQQRVGHIARHRANARAYKSAVTYAINTAEKTRGSVVWQRNYYEHIIRNDRELKNIGWYIINNPFNWHLDRDNLQNIRKSSPPEQMEQYVKVVEDMVLKLKADTQ